MSTDILPTAHVGEADTPQGSFVAPMAPWQHSKAMPDPKIAIIDDQTINIKIIQKYLRLVGYQKFVTTTDAREGVELVLREKPDVVLLDLIMPHVNGLDILGHLRRSPGCDDLPIIVVTAATEEATKLEALQLGATEFLHKPVEAAELQIRVRNMLLVKLHQDNVKQHAHDLEQEVAARTADLVLANREVVRCLATVGEYRDNETGLHTLRVGCYAEIIARRMHLGPGISLRIRDAAALHDIGKVAIPDQILLKPGKLDAAEFDAMKRHCELGRNVCISQPFAVGLNLSHTTLGRAIANTGSSPTMKMAAIIAYTHHERWDGTGYPQGLSGNDIPVEGRITALADVFDALTSRRPYKPAFPLDQALDIVAQARATQFDPDVVDAFFGGLEEVLAIYYQYNPDAVGTADCDPGAAWHGSFI